MYPNLEAELARRGMTKLKLAKLLNMRYPTLIDKLNGKSRMYFDDAIRIRSVVCPEADLDYLFEKKGQGVIAWWEKWEELGICANISNLSIARWVYQQLIDY